MNCDLTPARKGKTTTKHMTETVRASANLRKMKTAPRRTCAPAQFESRDCRMQACKVCINLYAWAVQAVVMTFGSRLLNFSSRAGPPSGGFL